MHVGIPRYYNIQKKPSFAPYNWHSDKCCNNLTSVVVAIAFESGEIRLDKKVLTLFVDNLTEHICQLNLCLGEKKFYLEKVQFLLWQNAWIFTSPQIVYFTQVVISTTYIYMYFNLKWKIFNVIRSALKIGGDI